MSAPFEGMQVHVSDVERTLLDVLDHPSLVGGIERAVSLFKESLRAAKVTQLIQYAVAGSRLSTCQRLGVLLERTETSTRVLAPLHRKVGGTKSLLSIRPNAPRVGPVNQRWNVVENDL
jgi:predicted transcriptional regulator of viral defense system